MTFYHTHKTSVGQTTWPFGTDYKTHTHLTAWGYSLVPDVTDEDLSSTHRHLTADGYTLAPTAAPEVEYMATWTSIELRNRVLEHLGVKQSAQSANAEDAKVVDEAINSAHDRLRKLQLVPFDLSAIPTWAQVPLRDYVAGDVARSFGFGDTLKPGQAAAELELRRQLTARRQPLPIEVRDY